MSKQDTWNKLRPNLQIIINDFEQGIDPKRYMEIYTMIYDHCVKSSTTEQKSGASFAGEDIYTEFRRYIENEVDILCKQADSYLGESLLEFYNKRWTKYTLSAQVINHLFQYLNRHWIKRKIEEGRKDVYEIYTLFLVTWRDKFLGNQSAKASKAILSLIERERNGESINTSLVQGVIKSFVELGVEMSTNSASPTDASLTVYTKHFEAPFIEDSKNYYTLESSKFLSENSVTLYIKKVEQRLKEEENRVKMYLHESTLSKIIQECETQLIEKHKDAITEECKKFFESHSIEDFGRVYNLLSRINKGLDSLRLDFEKHVKEDGLKSVAPITEGAENDPKPYVESLLGVHRKYHEVVVQAFKNDSGFIASLDRACREFVNRNSVCGNSPTKSPELLARFCDNILKKSAKTPEENELEETLKGVMVIFKYLEDKDVFQRFYSKMLAKRLVHGQSVSEDSEESMISKLKEACGYEYTTKLHRMFNDVQTSKDLTREFKDKVSSSEDGDIPSDITLLVLCTGSWPLSASNTPFTLPQELQKSVNKFQMYYQNKHSGRKLNWLYHMSKGEVKTNYTKSSFFFQVSAYQIGILLQYNSAEVYTVEDLMNNTQLTEDITKQILEIFSKARILIAEGPEGALSTKYRLNTDFKSKKIRVNLNMPLKVEKKQEDEETKKHIEEDRKMLIQAAAVRVMKTRKQLKHVELMNEIISQLQNRFKPSVPDIKKCIDILIEKDYLERVDGERDTYSYVA